MLINPFIIVKYIFHYLVITDFCFLLKPINLGIGKLLNGLTPFFNLVKSL